MAVMCGLGETGSSNRTPAAPVFPGVSRVGAAVSRPAAAVNNATLAASLPAIAAGSTEEASVTSATNCMWRIVCGQCEVTRLRCVDKRFLELVGVLCLSPGRLPAS